MNEHKTYCYRNQFPSAADKAVRAQAIRARMAMGRYISLKGRTLGGSTGKRGRMFPNGKNDDQVDVLSLIGRMLDAMLAG